MTDKHVAIIGAGFTGATIAHILAEAGKKVVVYDSRNHIAGNAYDYIDDESGVRVHKYGPHLFHTKNQDVALFLHKFTWPVEYKHKVKALYAGHFLTLPVNAETKKVVPEGEILDVFFRPYTRKMWGVELDELNPSIIQRIPTRDDDNEFYFPDDPYQFMPKFGYTHVVTGMLSHPNITVILNTPITPHIAHSARFDGAEYVFNCAPIDEWFEFCYGELPYRSIKFHHAKNHRELVPPLPTATVNFTDDEPYTRVTEWEQIPNHVHASSHLRHWTYEEPCDYKDNNMERYYPVKDMAGKNKETYLRYRKRAEETYNNMKFVGRCGSYAYLDIDQAINQGMRHAEKYLKENT